jgi:Tol biopolymer transport system component
VAGEHPRSLEDLADAVVEGLPVDWASAESSSGTDLRAAIRHLRVVAEIAGLHRSLADAGPLRPKPVDQPLDRWGRLQILERIGRGSFGDVYRAWDSKLDREVAVKLLHTTRAEAEAALREARLLARVRHQNVVTVHDADEIDGRFGLWMELLEGQTLEEVLRERKRFVEPDVVRVGIELCRALAAVHGAGLLHRDIKAQNLMQTADGRLVLMDFGTGRELEVAPSAPIDAAGTPLYLAPEIFSGAAPTARSDIYSAGVLLFHLWTGGYPVRGANIEEVQAAHTRGQRVDLMAAASRASRTLAAAIGRAIEPNPAKRFQSAKELLAALEDAQHATETRKRKRAWVAGSVVFVALIAVAVASVARQRRPPDERGPESSRPTYFGAAAEKRAVRTPRWILPGIPSPDGRFLPYTEPVGGNLALYEFATGESRTLTTAGDGGDVNWASGSSIVSGDNGRIAYGWSDSTCDCTQLRVIDSDGRNERVLYGEQGAPEIDPLEWSADGTQILGARKGDAGVTDVLLVSVSDGSVQVIRTLRNAGSFTWSPDNRLLAYNRSEGSSDAGIFIAGLDGSPEIPVVTGPTDDSHPMWTPDGSGLVFASLRTGGPSLWMQRLAKGHADGKPRLIDKDMGPFAPYTLTRRGSLFYDHRTGLMDVYTAPIDPATGEVVGEAKNAANRFLGSNIAADWSPDGDSLVFASWRTLFGPGSNVLVFHSFRTGEEREIELDLARANGVRWSPDGRVIAVGGPDRKGVRALRLIDPASGKTVSEINAVYGSFAWDADGRHAYVRRDTWEISRIDVGTGEEQLLYQPPERSVPGAIALSPDGRWLVHNIFMQGTQSPQLILIPTAGGQIRTLVDMTGSPVMLGLGGWTRDGRQVLFTQTTSDSEGKHVGDLWAVPFAGGLPRRLGLSMRALRDVRVSPDGTRISFTAGYPDRELWVFENFLPQTQARLTNLTPGTENPTKDPASQTKR